jgi:hypothetical protein
VLLGLVAVSAVAVPFCAAEAKAFAPLTPAGAITPLIGNGLTYKRQLAGLYLARITALSGA